MRGIREPSAIIGIDDMAESSDWRLTGQEHFLRGAILHWAQWHPPRPEWDHDHCEFCFAKFAEDSQPEVLHAGYTTADEYHWVCQTCVEDYQKQFGWQVEVI